MAHVHIFNNHYSHGNMCVDQRKNRMTMMMPSGLDDMTKQRMMQAKALCNEARGGKCGCGDTIDYI